MRSQRIWFSATYLLILIVSTINASYKDGKLHIGEDYKQPIYSSRGYQVYQLPFGITTTGIKFNTSSIKEGEGIFALDYVLCPEGVECEEEKEAELLAVFEMESMKVKNVMEISTPSTLGRLVYDTVFPFQLDANGFAYVLTDGKPIGKLIKINTFTGEVSHYIPKEGELSSISSGILNIETKSAYLLDYSQQSIRKISLDTMKEAGIYNLTQSAHISRDSLMAFDNSTNSLYVTGNDPNTQEPNIIHMKCLNYGMEPLSNRSVPFVDQQKVTMLFMDDKNHQLFTVSESKVSASQKSSIVVTRLRPDTLQLVDSVVVSMRECTGYFFQYRNDNDLLYLISGGGEIVRIELSPTLNVTGVMTVVTEHHSVKEYSPLIMPTLRTPVMYTDEIVYISCTWWGMIVKANLTNFCTDQENCDPLPAWVVPFTVIGGVLFSLSVLTICAVVTVFNRRKEARQLPYFLSINSSHEGLNLLQSRKSGLYGSMDSHGSRSNSGRL